MFFVRIEKHWHTALGLLIGMTLSAGAHVGDRVYPISYLTDEMLPEIQLDDGRIDEWIELLGEPAMTLLDFIDESGGAPPDPSNFDFRIWLAWHDEPARIYLALVASDDVYKNTLDYSADQILRHYIIRGRNDGLLLGIDGDHTGGPPPKGKEQEIFQEASGETQYYEAISRTPGGPTLDDLRNRSPGAFSWRSLPPYGVAGGGVAGEAPVLWVIELYVTPFDRWGETWDSPEGSVVSDLSAGQVIGFAVGVQDSDPREGSDRHLAWWVPEAMDPDLDSEAFHNIEDLCADCFIDGLLLPAGGTAVESVTWGRIKASLEME